MRDEEVRIKNSIPYGEIFRSTVKERFLPALLLIAAAISAIQFLPGLGFFAVLQLLIFLSLLEFYNLYRDSESPPYKVLGILVAIMISAAFLFDIISLEITLLASLFLAAVYPLLFFKNKENLSPFASAMALTLLGPVYINLTVNHIYLLREERGALFIYYLIIIIIFGDTAAYFVGKFWGKHRLAPKISPHKTWEGGVAGLICSALGGILIQAVFFPEMVSWKAGLIAVLVHAVAQISDLLESLFKRSAGKKDSSTILGGHGGFLDRIDSFILAAPFFYYILKIVRLG
jgi:phosphatidate cytidylyltransferase